MLFVFLVFCPQCCQCLWISPNIYFTKSSTAGATSGAGTASTSRGHDVQLHIFTFLVQYSNVGVKISVPPQACSHLFCRKFRLYLYYLHILVANMMLMYFCVVKTERLQMPLVDLELYTFSSTRDKKKFRFCVIFCPPSVFLSLLRIGTL